MFIVVSTCFQSHIGSKRRVCQKYLFSTSYQNYSFNFGSDFALKIQNLKRGIFVLAQSENPSDRWGECARQGKCQARSNSPRNLARWGFAQFCTAVHLFQLYLQHLATTTFDQYSHFYSQMYGAGGSPVRKYSKKKTTCFYCFPYNY